MALRAASNLQHWREAQAPPETERVFVPAGEEVPTDLYSDEELEELKAQGAVVDDGDIKAEEDLRKQVERLQAELDKVTAEREEARLRLPSPGTLYQTTAITDEYVEDRGGPDDAPTPLAGDARPGVVDDDALASAGSSKVAKGGEVKSPGQTKSQEQQQQSRQAQNK
jgi:hypothetical protein